MNLSVSLVKGAFIAVMTPRHAQDGISQLIAESALRGPVTVLDGGNCFAAYRIAHLIRCKSVLVNQIANRIFVRRAFTCYQTVSLLEETPALPQPHIILDLLSTFFDEQVKVGEAKRLLQICLKQIERLRFSAPVVVSFSPASNEERSFLVKEMCAQADEVLEFSKEERKPPMQMSLF